MQNLSLLRPVRSSRITQKFGENKACRTSTGKIVSVRNGVCPAGSVPFYQSVGLNGHNGHDIATIHGEAVVHAANFDGWMRSEKDLQGGIGVDVISKEPLFFPKDKVATHDRPYLTPTKQNGVDGYMSHVKIRYWHLLTPIGFDEKPVAQGQMIGLADNTGASSGDHLHWAPKWCDESGRNIARGNGYFGAFDQVPFYNHSTYAGDIIDLSPNYLAPTAQERKEMMSHLSILSFLFLELREMLYKL